MDYLKNNKFLIKITPLILFFFLVLNGVLGVKFGKHWDEWLFINPASESLASGVYLPHHYLYPSFCYYIVLITAGVYKIILGINDAKLLAISESLYQYVRCVFIVISSLSVIWVYLLAMKITKNYYASLIAGLIICSSFEFSYHSRWAVTDCIAVQFVILSTLILFLNLSNRNKIIFSSLIAGVAAGTKYTGGIVVLNIIIFILTEVKFNRENFKTASKYLFYFLIFFITGFIISTPGAVFEQKIFIEHLTFQKNIYANGHIGHTIQAGFDHFLKICEYIIFSLFSKNSGISIMIFLFAITGAASLLMKKKWNLSGLFITMVIYIIYVSSLKVMIVRNLLYVLPFIAVLASIGFDYISSNIKNHKFNYVFKIVFVSMLLYSCSYVVTSSLTIFNKSKINYSQELEKYIKENNDKEFIFSTRVSSLREAEPDNLNSNPNEKSYLVFYLKEVPIQTYRANIPDQFTKIIGIDDVNFDYYPTWRGEDRIIIMKYSNAPDSLIRNTLKK